MQTISSTGDPFLRDSTAAGTNSPSATVAALDGAGSSGTSPDYSRGDHKHADAYRHTHANAAALALVAGTNTGDQDLSGLVPKTTTVNGKALSANVTLTTADVPDSADKRYVTDAQRTVIGATSGANTGDETAAGIRTKLGITTLSGSNTGDETGSTILSKLGIVSISGINTGDETLSSIKSKLGVTTLSGANTGDQTITLGGDLGGGGTGSITATIQPGVVTLAKMANLATSVILGRNTAGTGVPEALTPSTVKAMLSLVKGDVGLGSVDNTADSGKHVLNSDQLGGVAAASYLTTTAGNAAYAPLSHVGSALTSAHPNAVANVSSGFISGVDQAKLNGLDASAYTPIAHVGSSSVGQHPAAVASVSAGFMTGLDKAKLDGLDGSTYAPISHVGSNSTSAHPLAVGGMSLTAGFMSGGDKFKLDAQSGSNTGDETLATIKSKLGITTLSGSNTGDQDLSGYVLKTQTVNGVALSGNITITDASALPLVGGVMTGNITCNVDNGMLAHYGSTAQTAGAGVEMYGKTGSSPGQLNLIYGGADATGKALFRNRTASAFVNGGGVDHLGNWALGHASFPGASQGNPTKSVWLDASGTNPTAGMSGFAGLFAGTVGSIKCPMGITSDGKIVKLYQQAHIANADGTLADLTTKFNALLAYHENLGLHATS